MVIMTYSLKQLAGSKIWMRAESRHQSLIDKRDFGKVVFARDWLTGTGRVWLSSPRVPT